MLRTLILAPWLIVLLAHAGQGPQPLLLAAAIVLVWAVPLVRDRSLSMTPTGH
ncbi:hypothetical protein AB0J83_39870 [Actinoplanes sp. NPDC049596]|uniref:hypothetical protein n=1 Tax=unclassified Actinoplanes TaxID=2626549 RepID=UPI003439ECC0